MKEFPSLHSLKDAFASLGCIHLYGKVLAANDNSKQQIYLGGTLDAVRRLPGTTVEATGKTSNKHFAIHLAFNWCNADLALRPARHAKLIYYPQYPEVRLSGFLRGVTGGPSALMNSRRPGRTLFLGVTRTGEIIAYAADAETRITKESLFICQGSDNNVFREFVLPGVLPEPNARRRLLQELQRIYETGWINSKQLSTDGRISPCRALNCGGLTLEAELGVAKNSRPGPDAYGWEVKQYGVPAIGRAGKSRITLMTPEPNGGIYSTEGAEEFIIRYGYADTKGRNDRRNFCGSYRYGKTVLRTGLVLTSTGYNAEKRTVADPAGCLVLLDESETIAASWSFASLLTHWSKKHQRVAYVPSQRRKSPRWQYRYGPTVDLAENTDFNRFMAAIVRGSVIYDPGMDTKSRGNRTATKRRSQFRIATSRVPELYESFSRIRLDEHSQ